MKKELLLFVLCLSSLFACKDNSNSVFSYLSDSFPRVSILTENEQPIVSKEDYINASVEVFGAGEYEDFSADLRIRGRGNSTWNHSKKPYQLKFDDKMAMLGMPEDKKWILLAHHSDKSLLRTELAFDLGRRSKLEWTPDSRFVELYINQKYQGLYQVTQKVEESKNRVNIGDDGFLLEVDQLDRLDADDVFFRTNSYLFNIKDPDLEYGGEKFTFIENYIQTTEEVLLGNDFLDLDEGYAKYIDVDSFVDWYLISELSKDQDAKFHTSVYMYLAPGEKLKMGPLWDFDIAFGNNKNLETRVFDPKGYWIKNALWMSRMFEDPAFVARVKARFDYFYAQREQINANIFSNAEYIDAAQARNYSRWKTLGKYVWPNHVYFDTYDEEVDYLMDWLDKRFEWMKVEIDAL